MTTGTGEGERECERSIFGGAALTHERGRSDLFVHLEVVRDGLVVNVSDVGLVTVVDGLDRALGEGGCGCSVGGGGGDDVLPGTDETEESSAETKSVPSCELGCRTCEGWVGKGVLA